MALILCPECGEPVSDMAFLCPHCGRPILQSRPSASSSVTSVGSFLHIAGLDLPKGTFCALSCSPDLVFLDAPRCSFRLSRDSILDISVIVYRDLISLHQNTLADECTNQAIKDALCKTIDISAKKRFIQPHTKFLLITYTGQDESGHIIIFQLNDGNSPSAQKLASLYAMTPSPQDIVL